MVKKQIDYQTLSVELDEILTNLQHPDVQVDEAVKLYEHGLKVIEQLELHLQQAQNKLTVLKTQSSTLEVPKD
jgi:exodeoxyribonuclease VII small subunit